jgi:hypothetical protein
MNDILTEKFVPSFWSQEEYKAFEPKLKASTHMLIWESTGIFCLEDR